MYFVRTPLGNGFEIELEKQRKKTYGHSRHRQKTGMQLEKKNIIFRTVEKSCH